MQEQRYFADVDLPFHVWVREKAGPHGARWVLKDARLDSPDGVDHLPPPGRAVAAAGRCAACGD